MSGEVCKCGRGYVSAYDGKCGHCRTSKEQKKHLWLLRNHHPVQVKMGVPDSDSRKEGAPPHEGSA